MHALQHAGEWTGKMQAVQRLGVDAGASRQTVSSLKPALRPAHVEAALVPDMHALAARRREIHEHKTVEVL